MLDLEDIFGQGGPLERALPDFRVRREQLRMAERVAGALAASETLVVEAGTGKCKSLLFIRLARDAHFRCGSFRLH